MRKIRVAKTAIDAYCDCVEGLMNGSLKAAYPIGTVAGNACLIRRNRVVPAIKWAMLTVRLAANFFFVKPAR